MKWWFDFKVVESATCLTVGRIRPKMCTIRRKRVACDAKACVALFTAKGDYYIMTTVVRRDHRKLLISLPLLAA